MLYTDDLDGLFQGTRKGVPLFLKDPVEVAKAVVVPRGIGKTSPRTSM